jgi:hypothetical protein
MSSSAVPQMPSKIQTSRIFELRYKKGGPVQQIHFRGSELESAIALGRRYCDRNNLQFIYVSIWEEDLEALLARKDEIVKVA